MADRVVHPGGPRRIVKPILASRVIGRTFRVWISSLPQLLVIAALVCVPIFAAKWILQGRKGWQEQVLNALPLIQVVAIASIAQAFAVRFVFQRLRGDRPDLGRSIAVGMKRVGVVTGIFLLLSAPQFIFLSLLLFFRDPLFSGNRQSDLGLAGSLLLALGVMGVFMLFVQLIFPVAAPTAVVESCGVFASLRRSAVLTKGARGTIFVILFIYFLICIIPGGALSFTIEMMRDKDRQFLARSAFDLVMASLTCVLPIVLYHELRETREGIGIDELASVFD